MYLDREYLGTLKYLLCRGFWAPNRDGLGFPAEGLVSTLLSMKCTTGRFGF